MMTIYAPTRADYEREAGTISWAEHVEATEACEAIRAQMMPSLTERDLAIFRVSAEYIAANGGFSWSGLVYYLGREPTTWQPAGEARTW